MSIPAGRIGDLQRHVSCSARLHRSARDPQPGSRAGRSALKRRRVGQLLDAPEVFATDVYEVANVAPTPAVSRAPVSLNCWLCAAPAESFRGRIPRDAEEV